MLVFVTDSSFLPFKNFDAGLGAASEVKTKGGKIINPLLTLSTIISKRIVIKTAGKYKFK